MNGGGPKMLTGNTKYRSTWWCMSVIPALQRQTEGFRVPGQPELYETLSQKNKKKKKRKVNTVS